MAIFDQHAAMLAASSITPEHARARGYVSVDTKVRLEKLGITKAGRNVPGLLVPMRDKAGEVWGYQYRPDTPRHQRDRQAGQVRDADQAAQRHRRATWCRSTARRSGRAVVDNRRREESRRRGVRRAGVHRAGRRVVLARNQRQRRQGRSPGLARHRAERPPCRARVRLRRRPQARGPDRRSASSPAT